MTAPISPMAIPLTAPLQHDTIAPIFAKLKRLAQMLSRDRIPVREQRLGKLALTEYP